MGMLDALYQSLLFTKMLRSFLKSAAAATNLTRNQSNLPNSIIPTTTSILSSNYTSKSSKGSTSKAKAKSKPKSATLIKADEIPAVEDSRDLDILIDEESRGHCLAEEINNKSLDIGPNGRPLFTKQCPVLNSTGGETNLALKFLYKMRVHKCKPSLSTYNSLIKCLCQEGSFEDVKPLIGCIEGQGILPNLATYLIMVNEHCKRGDLFSAFEVFEEMNERGLQPSVAIYDSIIGALCNDERFVEAEHMFKMMLKAGVAADEVVYTTLINGYSKNGKPNEACRLFYKMIKSGIKPSSHAYAALINGLIKKNMTKKGLVYLSRMLDDGLVPDIVLYTMLINQFCRKGNFSFALSLFDLMVRNNIHPDLITYGSLISGVCRNDLHNASRDYFAGKREKDTLISLLDPIISKTMNHNQSVPWNSYGEMIDYALKLMQDAKENGLIPDLHLHNAVINGYCRAGRMQDAYAHLELMQEDGVDPNHVTYTTFIDGFISVGEMDRAIQLFNKMSLDGCGPDKVTYNMLIKGLCRTRRIIEALSLSRTMIKRGLYPSKVSYERLLKSLCDIYSRDDAFMTYEEMLIQSYVPCHCNYRLQSPCGICLSSFAFKVCEEMIIHGYVPCQFNYNRLLGILYGQNKLWESHKLIDMMLKRGRSADEAIKSQVVEACYKQGEFDLAFILKENILVYEDGGVNHLVPSLF